MLALLAVVALTAVPNESRAASSPPLSTQQCLERSTTTVLAPTYATQFRVSSPRSDWTYDARNTTSTAYPSGSLYPFSIGKSSGAPRACWVGGKVVGQQSRTLTWDEMKNQYDGDGLRIASNDWYVVDGLRVDNVEDGIAPRGPDSAPNNSDGVVIRNAYLQYIRDDCVENDTFASGIIQDSLFDGCSTGISEQADANIVPSPPDETFTLEDVLLRLQALPGPRGSNDPNVTGHGQLFKWYPGANSLVLRNSVFLVEKIPNGGDTSFPPGTVAENVRVVWLGGGPFPGTVPTGVTITTDRSVWDNARADWLARHGCSSFDSCSKLTDPDPIGGGPPVPVPPTVSLTSPTNDQTFTAPTDITLSADATDADGTVGRVEFFQNSVSLGEDTTVPYSYAWTGVLPGSYSLTAIATDDSGFATTSASINIIVNPAPPTTLTFSPIDDASIRKGSPSRNYGSSGSLTVDLKPQDDFLIKFSVAGIGGRRITSAKLRMYTTDSSGSGGSFHQLTSNSWTESTLTWSNAPAAQSAVIGSLAKVVSGTSYEVDLTSFITGDGIFGIRVNSTSSDSAGYASKEFATVNSRPVLTLLVE